MPKAIARHRLETRLFTLLLGILFVATGALAFLTAMGLFIGQSAGFFAYMKQLAQDADSATRGV